MPEIATPEIATPPSPTPLRRLMLPLALLLACGAAQAQAQSQGPAPAAASAPAPHVADFAQHKQRVLDHLQRRSQQLARIQQCAQAAQDEKALRACFPHRGHGPHRPRPAN